ncbi:MAG: hypothetical protein UW46_C0004G0078 [Candidatus Yanofskybacteria bacterium GW2011_GWF1_44_227]|uniref:Uncharacterized protein n=1 Tax=Candidatus Yanofskybacteria bacterium GW2011_GWE2_40_11 TaxID=1619033 RepID=A0A0G0QKI0_9BACT|nr:MAG: hypothetical protein UT69_C0009G0010 [Candidatus Yanofskybacteria bacterium GW2011_GWE1_40_10]KKR40603.1 MAG: hypothetical protein UT75_C0007G0051 [Candidatus Yanofskybacteria bacterium GW2011_GWE2_40_11]KKT15599.1 MAG: hypothetical protein UV97_C0004G0015 [Candidatus Yanofskybacteria bacterium GW2011_GWF2_43_596]KKT53351.1 MAG: hypothetical protein UW46_C0004G0078 [Candidatus Yanofskybacteria bacterium GW2011_GWF1_44_227]OGN35978.1 MAG: hypothetical protein A2207_02875 [Candidatus Yano
MAKNIKISLGILVLALAIVVVGVDTASAYGVDINVNGNSVNVDRTTGNVNVNSAGTNANVNVNSVPGGGVNVNAGNSNANVNVNAVPGSVRIDANGRGVTVQNQASGVNVVVPGTSINVRKADGNLNVLVNKNSLSEKDKGVLVNLQNGSEILINSDQDVDAYAKIVVEERPAITNVEVSNNRLEVSYRQPSRFLGIFSTELDGTVYVDVGKNVTIKLPWYSFLFRKNSSATAKQVSIAINDASSNGTVQVSALGSAEVSNQSREQARLINIVTGSVNNSVSISVSQ